MKFKVNDTVLITGGKDKGKQGKITRVIPKKNLVVVAEMNMYSRHVKPYGGQSGDITRKERPLPLSKVAIVNDKGKVDRVGYKVDDQGKKQRVFKKTGKAITKAVAPKKTPKKTTKKKK